MLETVEYTIAFRFLQLDKLQALTLVREIQGSSYCLGTGNNSFVGSVPLLESYMDDINHFFIRQKVLESECDILISTQPEAEQYIVKVPSSVNRMLKDIDCRLTFSCALPNVK